MKIFAVIFALVTGLIYNFLSVDNLFWDGYYFATRDLSISLLIYSIFDEISNLTIRTIFLFTAAHYFVSAFGELFLPIFYISLFTFIVVSVYGLGFRTLYVRRIISDEYNETGNFIIIRKPKRIFELLRAYFFLDSIGSIKVVKSGRQIGFKIKKHNVEACECRHTHRPDYYIYIRTNKDIKMKKTKYNLLFNNCISCWDIDIKKEINKNEGI